MVPIVCGKFTTAEAGNSGGDGSEEKKNKMEDVPDEKKNATTKKSEEMPKFFKSGTHFT